MIKSWLILTLLILIVLSSGCVDQPPPEPKYKDDALNLKTEIPEKTLPNQIVNMKVILTNQVEKNIGNIILRITDFYKLTLTDQTCPDATPLEGLETCGFISDKCGCYFDTIQSLDDKEINFVFRVPDEEELARIGRDLEPEINLSYDYYGETVFFVPILSVDERSTDAKIRTTQTKGPIHVEVQRSLTQSSDPWERDGVAFPIIVWVKDKINPDSERTINQDKFNITLINLKTAEEAGVEAGRCDFSRETVDENTVLWPLEDIELPMKTPLICTLVGDVPDGTPWINGMVVVDYDYTYTIVKTEIITVETVIV